MNVDDVYCNKSQQQQQQQQQQRTAGEVEESRSLEWSPKGPILIVSETSHSLADGGLFWLVASNNALSSLGTAKRRAETIGGRRRFSL